MIRCRRHKVRLAVVVKVPRGPDFSKHIDQSNKNLKAAGLHPSQVDPLVIPVYGDIYPHIELPVPPPVHFKRLNARKRAILRYAKWLGS